MGLEDDPYRFNMIRLGIDLTYTKQSYSTSARTDNTEGFEQRYTLDVRGLVINPNLMVYNAGMEFVDADQYGTGGEKHSNLKKYVFGSTLLRKSRIPLTLSTSRGVTNRPFEGEATTDTFDADWYLKFRTLPWTRLTYSNAQTHSSGQSVETEYYGIGLTKAIGPTANSINYTATTTADSMINHGSEKNVFTLRNDTTVPLKTKFYIGVVNNDFSSYRDNDIKETDTTAGSVGLRTEPVAGFNQNYNYTFTNTKTGGSTETGGNTGGTSSDSEYFDGRIDYKPSKNLKMIMGVQSLLNENTSASEINTSSTSDNYYSSIDYGMTKNLDMFMDVRSSLSNKTSSSTSETKNKTMSLSAGTRYAISKELSTVESIRYNQSESSYGDQLTGVNERTIINTNAALNYLKELSWAALSSGVSFGHNKETVKPGQGGEGASSGFNASLSGINMRYFTLSSGYSYSNVNSYIGNVDREDQTFTANANSSYISYLPFGANYTYHTLDTYLKGEDGVENTVGANASMLYLKKLPITASYSYYSLSRPNDPPEDLQYVYIEEKEEQKFLTTASIHYIKWLPISTSYSHYTLVQPAFQAANLSPDQQSTHILDKTEDTVTLTSSLIYFRNTTASASAEYVSYNESVFNSYSWVSEENSYRRRSLGINGGHSTRLYRGNLKMSTGYKVSTTDNITANIREEVSNLIIKGTYNKKLSRNVIWKLEAEWNYNDTNGRRDTATTGQTNILYRLREWYLSAEYLHANREQEANRGAAVTEDKVMLKVSRNIVRTF